MTAAALPRRGRGPALLFAILLAGCASAASTPPATRVPEPAEAIIEPEPAARLEAALRERIARDPEGSVGVVAIDLATGLRVDINAHERVHAASTMKVPILIELYRQAAGGRLSLDDSLTVTDTFRSILGDTSYTLSPADDSDSTLYTRVGARAGVRELARLMIVRSSNLATNLLIERIGPDSVMATQHRIGAPDMHVLRGVEDGPAYRAGLNNTTTAAAFATTLEAIARCVANTPDHCREMLEILSAQEFDDGIPSGLPAGTRVAHKTGWITGIDHDGAIVMPPDRPPFVLVVLTRGYADRATAARLQGDLARIVWDAWGRDTFAAIPRVDEATRDLLRLQLAHRVDAIANRHFTHEHFWTHAAPRADRGFRIEQVGRSLEGRAIRLVSWGNGPRSVLLWSQMHGDESTATMALADLIRYLESDDDTRQERWRERITIHLVPMLNPDGAERFVRHNAVGIDVNRDARVLATPEGRALKGVRDRIQPEFGFNLHDQNPRTRVGPGPRLAAIALLAPPFDSTRADNPVRTRAKHVAAVIRTAIAPLVGGHVARYDDAFNPRAFGDLMTQWGTSTVLIESGGYAYDPQKQFLRAVNFVGLVRALDAIAEGDWERYGTAPYETLLQNGRAVNDLLLRGGSIVLPGGRQPVRADIAADLEFQGGRPVLARITEVGDLTGVEARDTIDLDGLFLHPMPQPGEAAVPTAVLPRTVASFIARRGTDPSSEAVWIIERGFVRRAATGS